MMMGCRQAWNACNGPGSFFAQASCKTEKARRLYYSEPGNMFGDPGTRLEAHGTFCHQPSAQARTSSFQRKQNKDIATLILFLCAVCPFDKLFFGESVSPIARQFKIRRLAFSKTCVDVQGFDVDADKISGFFGGEPSSSVLRCCHVSFHGTTGYYVNVLKAT